MNIVFATHNLNKLKEVQAMMPSTIKLLSLDDIGCFEDIPETSDTIEGNAMLKADYIKRKYKKDCFADDTGLQVKVLNGAPGVHSARYAGEGKNNEENIDKLLLKLKNEENRAARFKTVIALNFREQQILFNGICRGHITHKRMGDQGFGYDPVFKPDGYDKTFAQMNLEEKSAISHRGIALKDLIEYLSQ